MIESENFPSARPGNQASIVVGMDAAATLELIPVYARFEPRPCRHCAGFGSDLGYGIWCARHEYVNALRDNGCSSWQREPGSDDE